MDKLEDIKGEDINKVINEIYNLIQQINKYKMFIFFSFGIILLLIILNSFTNSVLLYKVNIIFMIIYICLLVFCFIVIYLTYKSIFNNKTNFVEIF